MSHADLLAALGYETLAKAHYTRRTGGPGHYKYFYGHAKAESHGEKHEAGSHETESHEEERYGEKHETLTVSQAEMRHPHAEVIDVIDRTAANGDARPAIFVWNTEKESVNDDGAHAEAIYWLAKSSDAGKSMDPLGVFNSRQIEAIERDEAIAGPARNSFGLQKSWDKHTEDHDDAAGWYAGRPRLSKPATVELEPIAKSAPRRAPAPPAHILEELAKSAVDAALRDAYRFELVVCAGQNHVGELLIKGAYGHERPSLPPHLVADGALTAPPPNLIRVVQRAAATLRSAAQEAPPLAAGLKAIRASERMIGERLAQLALDPERAAAGG